MAFWKSNSYLHQDPFEYNMETHMLDQWLITLFGLLIAVISILLSVALERIEYTSNWDFFWVVVGYVIAVSMFVGGLVIMWVGLRKDIIHADNRYITYNGERVDFKDCKRIGYSIVEAQTPSSTHQTVYDVFPGFKMKDSYVYKIVYMKDKKKKIMSFSTNFEAPALLAHLHKKIKVHSF